MVRILVIIFLPWAYIEFMTQASLKYYYDPGLLVFVGFMNLITWPVTTPIAWLWLFPVKQIVSRMEKKLHESIQEQRCTR